MTRQKKLTRNEAQGKDSTQPLTPEDETGNSVTMPDFIKQYIQELDLDFHQYEPHPDEDAPGQKTLQDMLTRYGEAKLSACEKSWKEGNILGLAKAVKLCSSMYGWPLPPWCEEGVQRVLTQTYFQGQSGKKGRHSRIETKLQQDQVHFVRWCKVKDLRENPEKLKTAGFKPTWEATYEKASLDLRGTAARGEPGAIKDSYRRVQADMKAGKAAKYYVG